MSRGNIEQIQPLPRPQKHHRRMSMSAFLNQSSGANLFAAEKDTG